MDRCTGLGLYVDKARYIPTNALFKNGDISKERIVECYELVLFLKDGGYSFINGKKYPITAGCVRFHRPGDRVYSYRFNEIYVIHFTVDNAEKGKESFSSYPPFLKLPDTENEINIIKKLIAALLVDDDLGCVCSLCELLGRIKEHFAFQQKSAKEPVVSSIKKYIDERFSQKLTLSELSQRFHLHPVYLQRKFKEATGITPAEYHKRSRLSKAKAYLLTTDLSIDEISVLCGFCNTSYFIDVFKESEGITPFKFKQKIDMAEMN